MNKLLIAFILFSSSLAFAQEDSAAVKLFKISPLHLFDFDNGISFAFEKQYSESKTWQVEAGYGHSSANFWIALVEDINGDSDPKGYHNFRVRAELRKYFRKNQKPVPAGAYYAVELMSKYVFKNSDLEIGRSPIGGQVQFNELVRGRTSKRVIGTHAKLGTQFYFDQSDKWLMDIFAGLGFRVVSNTFNYDSKQASDIPNFRQRGPVGTIIDPNRTALIISGTLGLKFSRVI